MGSFSPPENGTDETGLTPFSSDRQNGVSLNLCTDRKRLRCLPDDIIIQTESPGRNRAALIGKGMRRKGRRPRAV